MLETIKSLLGITDTSRDAAINHKIAYYQLLIMDYCFEDTFSATLEPIVVELVVNNIGVSDVNSVVKSVKRGDTTIQYGDTKNSELSPYTNQLSYHRRIRVGGM